MSQPKGRTRSVVLSPQAASKNPPTENMLLTEQPNESIITTCSNIVGVDVESGRKVLKGKDLVDSRVVVKKQQPG